MRRPVILIFSVLLFCLSLGQLFYGLSIHVSSPLVDFEVYYRAGRYFLSGLNPYSANFPPMQLNYPPSSLPFFALWNLLSYPYAQLIFTASSLFLFLFSCVLLMQRLKIHKALILLVLALLVQAFPTKFTLVLGQVNLILLSLVIFAFLLNWHGRKTFAGLLWGLASGIKLTPLSLGIYFLIRKDWQTLFAGIFTFALLNLASISLVPGSLNYYFTRLPILITLSQPSDSYYNQSLKIFFQRLSLPSPSLLAALTILALLFSTVKNYLRKQHASGKKEAGLLNDLSFYCRLLILSVISQSVAWQHHFVLTFPAFILIAVRMLHRKKLFLILATVFSAFLIGLHFTDPARLTGVNPLLASHTTIGSILLFLILTLRYN